MYRRLRRRASVTMVPVPRDTARMRPSMLAPSVRNPFASTLWRNQAFVRVWSAGDDLDLRVADHADRAAARRHPVLGSGAIEVAILRSLELVADARLRARRRGVGGPAAPAPGADLGGPRAGGAARLDPGRVRARRADVLAAADRVRPGGGPDDVLRLGRQRLPADDRRAGAAGRGERRAGGERLGGRVHGLRDQRLPRPGADRADRRSPIDAVSYLVSAVLLGDDPARGGAAAAARGPRAGARRDPRGPPARPPRPVLRAFVGAQMALAALWGIFGATWFLFVLEELGLEPGGARRHRRGRRRLVVHRRGRRDAGDARWGSGRSRSWRCSWRRSATCSSRSRRPGSRSSRSAAWSSSSSSATRR